MANDKLATISSSLSPYGSAPPRVQSSTPGLGEKMRAETSSTLEKAMTKGKTDALAKFKVKAAAVPLAHPFPSSMGHPTVRMSSPPAMAAHAPTAPAVQPSYNLTPHEEAQAQQMKGMSHTQRQQAMGLDRDSQNAAFMQQHGIDPNATHAAPAATAPAARGGVGRFLRPAGKTLGLGALAAGGALAYGMHEQNKTDRENYPLVYAPMSGGF